MPARERFVPRRVGQVTAELGELAHSDVDGDAFQALSRLVAALYHFEFYDREQAVLDAWEHAESGVDGAGEVRGELERLLRGADYTAVTMEELEEAMSRESLVPLRLHVDLEEYEELLIFRRGSRPRTVEVPRLKGLRTVTRRITVEDRVVVLTRIRPRSWFDERGIDPAARNLTPGNLSLKQFQQVPRADIEMLLPNTRVRLRPVDTLLVGVPAVASGIAVLATKLLPTLGLIVVLFGAWLGIRDEEPELDQGALVVLLGGLVTLGGFVLRQWTKLKNRRVEYLKTLSETLYFRTLGDGPGVLHALLASAEQQEVVEALLGYRFLLDAPAGLDAGELDRAVEAWLAETHGGGIDFDIDDAVDKLRDLDLVEGDTTLRARPIDDALAALDRRWDDLFRHQPDGQAVRTSR